MCIGCDELLTIEHILLTCSDLIEIRECVCLMKKKRNRRIPVSKQTSSSVSTELSSFMPTYVIRHNTFN